MASGGASDVQQRAYFTNTTFAGNKAARLPDTWLVGVKDTAFDPADLPILSEDEVRFENRTTGQPVTLFITPGEGVTCQPAKTLVLPAVGLGPSAPLICKASANQTRL